MGGGLAGGEAPGVGGGGEEEEGFYFFEGGWQEIIAGIRLEERFLVFFGKIVGLLRGGGGNTKYLLLVWVNLGWL